MKENKMKFDNFEISSKPKVINIKCKKCGEPLLTTSIPTIWYCTKCKNCYTLRLVQMSKAQTKKHFIMG